MLSFYEITQQGSAPSTKDKRLWGPTVPFLTSVCAPKGYCPVSSRESFLDSWPKIFLTTKMQI